MKLLPKYSKNPISGIRAKPSYLSITQIDWYQSKDYFRVASDYTKSKYGSVLQDYGFPTVHRPWKNRIHTP